MIVQYSVCQNLHAAELTHSPELVAPHLFAFVSQPISATRNPRDTVVNSILHFESWFSHTAIVTQLHAKKQDERVSPKE
jgi:hypothetical protein